MKRLCAVFLTVCLGAALLSWSGCSDRRETFTLSEQTIPAEGILSLSIDVNRSDVHIVSSEGESFLIRYYDSARKHFSVTADTGKLSVSRQDASSGSSLSEKEARLEIFVPASFSGTVEVRSALGNISLLNLTVGDAMLRTDVGNISIGATTLASLSANVGTGDLVISGVRCSGNVNASVAMGYLSGVFAGSSSEYPISATAENGSVLAPAGSETAARTMKLSVEVGSIYLTFGS